MQLLGQMDIGFLVLIPPFLTILLAYRTKDVFLSLGTGIYVGIILLKMNELNLFYSFDIFKFILVLFLSILEIPILFAKIVGDSWNAGIILQILFIGGIISLLVYSGGAKKLAEFILKRAKTEKQAGILTYIMGLLIFFDDYANALIVGPIMSPIIEKIKMSREKFAFIIDATAAPIAGMALISTWVGYELSLIQKGLDQIGDTTSAMVYFINSMPYRLYNILMLFFVIFIIIIQRDFGPMLKAQIRSKKEKVKVDKIEVEEDFKEKEGVQSSLWDGIIPILLLIISSFILFLVNGYQVIIENQIDVSNIFGTSVFNIELVLNNIFSIDVIMLLFENADASIVLFQGAFITIIYLLIKGKLKKQYQVKEGIDVLMHGANKLLSTVFILIFAWGLGSVISSLGVSEYLIKLIEGNIPVFILPAIIFVLSGLMSFSTGTAFGTMAIIMPIIIPLGHALDPDTLFLTINISAVLTGATLGDHCSPISDTTILSSIGSNCNLIDHVKTQIPYALFVGIIALVGYILLGLGINIYILLALSISVIVIFMFIVGKKVDVKE